MIENDTIKLLRECDAGVKMGVKSIDDVIDYVMINDGFKALTYRVVNEGIDGRFVSDHYPIYADIVIK